MNTKILEYVLAIAEEGSVSRAAERFYLSQPALSSHLKHLEQEFGAPLFTRVRGRMELTRAGVLFTNNARIVLHMERKLEEELGVLDARQRRNIDVFIDHPCTNFFVLHVQRPFLRRYPHLHIEVNNSNASRAVNALREKRADLAICALPTPDCPGLESIRINEISLMLAFPPDYDGPLTPSAAMERGLLPMLHPIERTARAFEEECLSRDGIFPQLILESSSGRRAISDVAAGSCFAYIPTPFLPQCRQLGLKVTEPLFRSYTLLLFSAESAAREPVGELIRLTEREFAHFQ